MCPIDLMHLIEPTIEDELSSRGTSFDEHQQEASSNILTLVSKLSILENAGWFYFCLFWSYWKQKKYIFTDPFALLHDYFQCNIGFLFRYMLMTYHLNCFVYGIDKTMVWLRSSHYVHGHRTSLVFSFVVWQREWLYFSHIFLWFIMLFSLTWWWCYHHGCHKIIMMRSDFFLLIT